MAGSINVHLKVKYLPLDQLPHYRSRVSATIVAPCFCCKGEGEDPRTGPWQPEQECPACRGEMEQRAAVVAQNSTIYVFLSRWLWELVTERRSLDPEEDQPWSGDPDVWKGGDQ